MEIETADMDSAVAAALITAIASGGVAVVSLLSSRSAAGTAARAEEASKRSEQVRVKATEAGEKLLACFADVVVAAESISTLLDQRTDKALSTEEIETQYRPLAAGAARAHRLIYENAIYLTSDIQTRADELLRPLWEGGVDWQEWGEVTKRLRAQHWKIAYLFRTTYLEPSPELTTFGRT